MDIEPTPTEKVKKTMESGWGFGFKLNDARDVRPSCIEFVKGRTPDEDLLLLAGTTRKNGEGGYEELDGFVTKLVPPPPSPVDGSEANVIVQDESSHPTKRIDSTTGRDETVTSICLPPPNPDTGAVTHAFVVGSIANSQSASNPSGKDPSLAYILMMKLDDMSTIWKQRIPSIHPTGIGGDVLGEGCAVSPDGNVVYLAGTIDGGSALNTGLPGNPSDPDDPNSPPIEPIGGTTDVFVVAYDVGFGNVKWGKQIGTVDEDKLARGGCVTVDNEGNVMIMGSTRGPMQRYRPNSAEGRRERQLQGQSQQQQTTNRLASDVFFMSLSRENGHYVNAPYTGSPSGNVNKAGSAFAMGSNGGLSAGGIAGISIAVIAVTCAVLLLVRRRRANNRNNKEIGRMWRNDGGDDFSFDQGGSGFRDQSIGGRKCSGRDRSDRNASSGALRIVRGGVQDDDWDDGADRISRSATWMTNNTKNVKKKFSMFKSSGDGSTSSISGTNSSGYKPKSYTTKRSSENLNFLSSLREEANSTMTKMFKDSPDTTTDPRLDDGASIKSLLSHYREVRKNKLFDGDDDSKKDDDDSVDGKKNALRSHPPPPPPRPNAVNNEVRRMSSDGSADGLAEFTIV